MVKKYKIKNSFNKKLVNPEKVNEIKLNDFKKVTNPEILAFQKVKLRIFFIILSLLLKYGIQRESPPGRPNITDSFYP